MANPSVSAPGCSSTAAVTFEATSPRPKLEGLVWLLDEVAKSLRRSGSTSWRLNAKPENHAAINLYTSLGFQRVHSSVALRFDWSSLEQLEPGPAVRVQVNANSNHDAGIEKVFGLPKGQLAALRAAQRVLVSLVDERELPVAFAAFNPVYPGAMPFRVGSPQFARAILSAMQPHALPAAQWTGLVVENDEALAQVLLSAGATVRSRIDAYVGSLLDSL